VRFFRAIQILAHHADGGPGHGLLDLPRGPPSFRGEGHPRPRLAGQLAGGCGGGAVEQPRIDVFPLAEADDEQVPRACPAWRAAARIRAACR